MVDFTIEKDLLTISSTKSTRKALTVTAWNGKPGKLDIRIWRDKDGETIPGKGICLDDDEAAALAAGLKAYLEGEAV